MSTDVEYVQGDRTAKVKYLGLLILLVALYLYFEFFYKASPPSVQNKQELSDYLRQVFFGWVVFAGISWFLAIWVLRLGLRSKRADRWPPPDLVMPFKTKIRRGQYVKFTWIACIFSATIMVISPLLYLFPLFQVSQILETLN